MDFSSSVAKRTRSRQALKCVSLSDRKNCVNGGEKTKSGECGSRKRKGSERSGSGVRDSTELGSYRRKKLKDCLRDCGYVVGVDDSEEDEVEAIDGDRDEKGFSDAGLKTGFESRMGLEKDNNVVLIEEDSEDEETEPYRGNAQVEAPVYFGTKQGIASRTRGKLGLCREMRCVSGSFSIDSDELQSSITTEDGCFNNEDHQRDNCRSSVSVEQCSYTEDQDGEDIVHANMVEGRKFYGDVDEIGTDDQLNCKIFSESDTEVPVISEKENCAINEGHNCVARRTRSHYNPGSMEAKKFGTISQPICVDEDCDCSFGHDDDDDDDENCKEDGNDENDEEGGNDEVETNSNCDSHNVEEYNDNDDESREKDGKLGMPTKRKRVPCRKNYNAFKILVNSILDKGNVPVGAFAPTENEYLEQEITPPVTETLLPLKFSFGIKESKVKEKSDYEKELDHLWAEFDFALHSCENGFIDSSMVDDEDTMVPELEIDNVTLCQQGKHELILDEEIGIRCQFCKFVKLEIKYIIPPLRTSTSKWSGNKVSSNKEDLNITDGLQFQDEVCDSQDSCVNIKGTVWEKIPGFRKSLYPHQREGFEFLWKNLAGGIDLEELKMSTGSSGLGGCVISHAPGTGKTCMTIVFLQSYMELYPRCRPVIVAPKSMLLVWEEELRKWKVNIPFHNLNKNEYSGKENVEAINLLRRNGQGQSVKSIRMVKMYSWKKSKSILGVSYKLFQMLAGNGCVDGKEHKKNDQIRKILLELPGLLVLDEGHTPRNKRSRIWKVLSRIETKRRIILSGTPFQNNFVELHNTLCLVRPNFVDMVLPKPHKVCIRRSESKRNVARNNWAFLTSSIRKPSNDELKNLKTMVAPFVHVYRGSILQKSLPGLRECVIVLNPSPVQKSLLEGIEGTNENVFNREHMMCLISLHPSLLNKRSLSTKEDSTDGVISERPKLNLKQGVKLIFLMELIRLIELTKEKVLVFSQFLHPLCFVEDHLKSLFGWTEGREVIQIDGKLDMKQRQSLINRFNDPTSEVRLLLASTRASCEGISLTGASRVVLLDVVWNPSVERQAISRAYRLGQQKTVYTYHLITSGMEWKKYCRQAEKDRLSQMVFCSTHRKGDKLESSMAVSEDKILENMVQHQKLKDVIERIIYQPKVSNLDDISD